MLSRELFMFDCCKFLFFELSYCRLSFVVPLNLILCYGCGVLHLRIPVHLYVKILRLCTPEIETSYAVFITKDTVE